MHIDGQYFKDEQGRTLLLRGVNLGGSSKVPTSPDGRTHLQEGFFDHRRVSFVGRPFPLHDADAHFARLHHWGMRFLRFLVTWEAVEHSGPGIYDEDYLDYLHAVIEKAHAHGIQVMIDPHQDAWSRWTGGDGAPGWTLEAIGIDLTKLHATGAAITHQMSDGDYPRMIWPTNFYKYGAATMFSLFFAGDDLAPATKIDGVDLRTYLQTHYINAMRRVAERLADLPNVVGFDTLNEPIRGFIEIRDLGRDEPHGLLSMGASPTPLQAMATASGHTLRVRRYGLRPWGFAQVGYTTLNPDGESIWQEGRQCVWKENDVWTDEGGVPRILKPYHFCRAHGRKIDFVEDYFKPFARRFTEAIRSVQRDHIIFIEGVPNTVRPTWTADDAPNVAYAGHWYDGTTLFLKLFRPFINIEPQRDQNLRFAFGRDNVQASFNRQLADLKAAANGERMGGIPALVGEFGLPMDMNNRAAYDSGDYSYHIAALDMYYNAMDTNLLSCTLWNYTSDNTFAHGDGWNNEDLSIFSTDLHTDPDDINSGGRALAAVVRPYALATAGEPIRMRFDLETLTFTYVWKPDRSLNAPTVLYIPKYHYGSSYTIEGDVGLTFEPDGANQTLCIQLGEDFEGETATVVITNE